MPRERFGSLMTRNMPLSPNIGQSTPNIPYSGVKPFQPQQPSPMTDMPNLSSLQQIMNLLMGNRPQNPLASAINGAMSNPWLEMGSPLSPSVGLPSHEQFGAMGPEQRMGATNKYYSIRDAMMGEHQRRLQQATQMGKTPTVVSGPGTSSGGTFFSPGYK